jgi:hypothetical protein
MFQDVTTLESAVKRAVNDGAKGVAGNDKVNAANKANARYVPLQTRCQDGALVAHASCIRIRAEAITVHHQPGQGFVPNLDLGQAVRPVRFRPFTRY